MALSSGTPASAAKFNVGSNGGGFGSQGVSGRTSTSGALSSGAKGRTVRKSVVDPGHGRVR